MFIKLRLTSKQLQVAWGLNMQLEGSCVVYHGTRLDFHEKGWYKQLEEICDGQSPREALEVMEYITSNPQLSWYHTTESYLWEKGSLEENLAVLEEGQYLPDRFPHENEVLRKFYGKCSVMQLLAEHPDVNVVRVVTKFHL